jgi:hypothetical protein
MKANEAPEKIYVSNYSSGLTYNWHNERLAVNDMEYIRTDAFIKKACQFIEEHHHEFSFWNTEEYELGFSTQKFIEDFKKYIKGE